MLPSCQMLLRSLLVGIEGVCDMAYRAKAETSNLGGFARLGVEERRYVCIGSIAHWPLHDFSLSLLEDDRFLRFAPKLKRDLGDWAQLVQRFPLHAYKRLALCFSRCGLAGAELRHDTCASMASGLACLERGTYNLLTQLPFSLTQGDLLQNLEHLRRTNTTDITARKFQVLMERPFYSEQELLLTLELLKDAPCSTALCEKSHGPMDRNPTRLA